MSLPICHIFSGNKFSCIQGYGSSGTGLFKKHRRSTLIEGQFLGAPLHSFPAQAIPWTREAPAFPHQQPNLDAEPTALSRKPTTFSGTPPKIKLRGDASELLDKLRALVEGALQKEHRNLQLVADLAWTHRDPVNATQLKAFGLQADRPLV